MSPLGGALPLGLHQVFSHCIVLGVHHVSAGHHAMLGLEYPTVWVLCHPQTWVAMSPSLALSFSCSQTSLYTRDLLTLLDGGCLLRFFNNLSTLAYGAEATHCMPLTLQQ